MVVKSVGWSAGNLNTSRNCKLYKLRFVPRWASDFPICALSALCYNNLPRNGHAGLETCRRWRKTVLLTSHLIKLPNAIRKRPAKTVVHGRFYNTLSLKFAMSKSMTYKADVTRSPQKDSKGKRGWGDVILSTLARFDKRNSLTQHLTVLLEPRYSKDADYRITQT